MSHKRRSHGSDTRVEILRAARHVLITRGYARLSMRVVAREAHVAVGNVVYYFASKRSLVHALILSMLEHYQITAQDYLRNAHGKSSFPALLRWYMRDSVSPETSRLFRELWAMALHDPGIAGTMDRFYDRLHRLAADRLRLARPLETARARHRAAPRHHFRGHESHLCERAALRQVPGTGRPALRRAPDACGQHRKQTGAGERAPARIPQQKLKGPAGDALCGAGADARGEGGP
jgi:AcrR family transcriptional regulator